MSAFGGKADTITTKIQFPEEMYDSQSFIAIALMTRKLFDGQIRLDDQLA
jgi:hypothetical protein